MNFRSRALGIAICLLLVSAPALSTVLAADPRLSLRALQAAADERATFGLASDYDTVRGIIASGQDIGTGTVGMVLTAEEETTLDLDGRTSHLLAVDELVLETARASANYAGSYVDQLNDGAVVLMLTDRDPVLETLVREAANKLDRSVSIEYTTYSFSALESAMYEAWKVWAWQVPTVDLLMASVDEEANSLVLYVSVEDVVAAQAYAGALTANLAVPVRIQESAIPKDDACTRESCPTPFYAGIQVYRGGKPPNHEVRCTMGFHVRNQSGQGRFLTSGHCGWAGSDVWYQPGEEFSVGQQSVWQYGPTFSPSRDVMSVTIPLSWERRKLWGNAAAEVTGVVAPTQNSFICASLGVSSVAWDCGTVATTSTTWTSSTCGCQQSGARHTGIATIDGDSGSPIIYSTGGSFKAVGVHDTAGGNFAKMSAIFSDWPGWTVYAP